MMRILPQAEFQNLETNLKEVWQRLGYPDPALASPAIQEVFHRAMEIWQTLIEPVACYDIFQIERVTPSSVEVKGGVSFESQVLAYLCQEARELAVFIVTIGPRLEEEVGKFFQSGNFSVGNVLDKFGSQAVSMVAYRVKGLIQDCALSTGYQVMTPYWYCPGYSDWKTSEQKKLFTLVDGIHIGVRLGEACMMAPVKSYSCVLPIGLQRLDLGLLKKKDVFKLMPDSCQLRFSE